MTIQNPKYQEHIVSWKRLRDEIFRSQDQQQMRTLFSDPDYEKVVKEVVRKLDKWTVTKLLAMLRSGLIKSRIPILSRWLDLSFFDRYLPKEAFSIHRLQEALGKIASQYTSKVVSTKLEDIYDLCAYSLVYGARSVASIQIALLEYFLDSSRVYFDDTIRILDLGAGTGSSIFGIVSFLKKYSKESPLFRARVKKIVIEFVEKEKTHHDFCHEMLRYIVKTCSELPKINFVSHQQKIEDFLGQGGSEKYDFVIASKSISELECLQQGTLDWGKYTSLLGSILNRIDQEGVFIFIETPYWSNPIRRKMISKTVNIIDEVGFFVYSPCIKDRKSCSTNGCSAWRVFRYLEPDSSREIRTRGRDVEKFYLFLITKTEHSIADDIIPTAEMNIRGELKFIGLFHPLQNNYNACISADLAVRYSENLRGKYLFKNSYDEFWVFGLDIEQYWDQITDI
ncbi:hypothetical protein EPN16_01460 [bacterium]|nr:MAG: hypothetical protein EPN16_01460 [bacterium]